MKIDREAFLERRRTGIGSSDAPAIMGVDDFGNTAQTIWLQKLGIEEDKPESIDILRGVYLEDLAAEVYKRQTGRTIRRLGMRRAKTPNEFAVAHLDRHIVADPKDGRGPGALEIKCPRLPKWYKISRTGMTQGIIVQVQHQLGVTGWKWAEFCIFHPEQPKALIYTIEREPEIIEELFKREEVFWRRHVLTREPPPEEVEELDIKLPEYEGLVWRPEGLEAWETAIGAWQEARELAVEVEALIEAKKEELQGLMTAAKAQVAEGKGVDQLWRFYWTQFADGLTFKKELIAAMKPLDPEKVQAALLTKFGPKKDGKITMHRDDGVIRFMIETLKDCRLDVLKDPRFHKTKKGGRPFRPFKIKADE